MKIEKISFNKAYFMATAFLVIISSVLTMVLYNMTGMIEVVLCCLFFVFIIFLIVAFLLFFVRCKLTAFSDTICRILDDMLIDEIEPEQVIEEESLFYKISHRLSRLYNIMRENQQSVEKERADLKELITDISHQVKTPIANLKTLNGTLLDYELTAEKRKDFLESMDSQLEKLNFLMQTMVKTSRLETGIISLKKREQSIYDTVAAALGGVLLEAEKKNISIDVACQENIKVIHDRKWTAEALFNVLDNAVKYTPKSGKINVSVTCLEMYLKIDVADTGKGIKEENQGAIFKRFYREDDVEGSEGLGIGLYLTRQIITMQGGYIRVSSEPGCGTTFSVLLPRG